ncbi:MAG: aminotransferase class V-fold PLP-dependent enzyme [Verrucomicrobia bacterium]|nr:aminotransferase class V-fold PLP-dependent enzyme [Verrucomicrobiota bacterium]MDA1066234.1 aminotransferase class V-fold PLP-dependent enzyme [Verrucomicrobiota bacterium]
MNKRTFIKRIALMGLTAPVFSQLESILGAFEHLPSEKLAKNNDFWAKIRATYKLKPDYINLESGFYCIQPEETLEHFIEHVREVNYQGSYYMRNFRIENKARITAKLAEMAGCGADELIITRNATESLDTVIGGYDWKAGDEAVYANQDYGAMRNMFELVEKRYGVVRRVIDVPMHPKSDEEIVEAYAAAITPKTRLLMVCHIINITGHILPIRKICDMAHSKGVDVMVDGAHAFGHFNFSISDFNCDYYGTSLHKWLSVPLGAGFLYVKKKNVHKIWPVFADQPREDDDILKLNHTGTHPAHTDLAIANAIDYHNRIGGDRKEARLRYIQNYWTDKARKMDHVIMNTPKERHRSCGIATVGIKGMDPVEMATTLLEKHKIWTVGINGSGVNGCRISPNVFTTTDELDVFVEALKSMG